MINTAMIQGITMARNEMTTEMTSSAKLAGALAVPPDTRESMGRTTTDLVVWTLPAINNPAARVKIGLISVTTLVAAAKATAPAAGRMRVWTKLFMCWTKGILSTKNSISERKISVPIIHQLSRVV